MRIKTILNRVQKSETFACGMMILAEDPVIPALEIECYAGQTVEQCATTAGTPAATICVWIGFMTFPSTFEYFTHIQLPGGQGTG